MMRRFWWNVSRNFGTDTPMRTKSLLNFWPNHRNRRQSLSHGNVIMAAVAVAAAGAAAVVEVIQEITGIEIIIGQTTEINTIGIMIIAREEIIDNTTIDHTIGIFDKKATIAAAMGHRINTNVLKEKSAIHCKRISIVIEINLNF